MLDITYDPHDWFWQVSGRTDYWSSAAGAYVETLPAGWFATIQDAVDAANGGDNVLCVVSPIGTEAELSDVLRPYGLRGPVISSEDVNAERDRRTATLFAHGGVAYQCDDRSQQNITAKGAQAKFAVIAGAQANDLRWANPNADFGWIATDNSVTPMDAQTMSAFADAADLWVTSHIMAGLALKQMDPVPTDFEDGKWWP